MPMPPVVLPMRWLSWTKSSLLVPMDVRASQKRGTSGRSLAGTRRMSNSASAYRMSLVKRSWRSTVAPCSSDTSLGTVGASFGMSPRASAGMHLSASGSSGVSCASLSAAVASTSASSSAGDISPRFLSSLAFSAASVCSPRDASGASSRVTLCVFSTRCCLSSGRKTSSPAAMRSFSLPRGASYLRGWKGSMSYSHVDMERSISDSPLGKRPVLFSRRANSMVFMDDATSSSVSPSSAIFRISRSTSASTSATLSGATPLRPMLKVGCLSSSSRPPPMSDSPSPDSSSALRSGLAGVPSMAWFRNPHARDVSRSKGCSASTQFRDTKCLGADAASSGLATYLFTTRLGSPHIFCVSTLESLTSLASNSLRNASATLRRSSMGSSP
mmetsp:Transcript_6913/g.24419  ORF Transcript_6913/g.24419 Transcript_6913/m.24419 type:complete len:386 (-) Transcript_6913:850-2007(-)